MDTTTPDSTAALAAAEKALRDADDAKLQRIAAAVAGQAVARKTRLWRSADPHVRAAMDRLEELLDAVSSTEFPERMRGEVIDAAVWQLTMLRELEDS